MKKVLNFISVSFIIVLMLPIWVIRLVCKIYEYIACIITLPITLITGNSVNMPEWWDKIDDRTLKWMTE